MKTVRNRLMTLCFAAVLVGACDTTPKTVDEPPVTEVPDTSLPIEDTSPDEPDSDTPTAPPTDESPSDSPTSQPTDESPTDSPTSEPTDSPTSEPTDSPTSEPTDPPITTDLPITTDEPPVDTETGCSGEYFVPGCGDTSTPSFAAGCYETCTSEGSTCATGGTCTAVTIDPCYNSLCQACGAPALICLP